MAEDENDSVRNNKKDTSDDNLEDRLLSVLESAMKPTEKLGEMSRESQLAFISRLSSFSTLNYFGKPSSLSPLVCARLGWRNAEKDLLVCSSCNAAVAILLHPGLSPDSKEKLCRSYRDKLATCHKTNCPFKVEGEELLRFQNEEENAGGDYEDTVIPSYFVDVFPTDCVELVEHPTPSTLLQRRAKHLEESCPSGYKFPELEIPESIRKELDSAQTPLYQQLKTVDESTAILAMMGWEPTEQKKNPAGASILLGCRFCYSQMELKLEKDAPNPQKEQTTELGSPPKKKTRLSRHCAPLDAHRHYCPYVCGFPSCVLARKRPIWKTIVDRLGKEAEQAASESKEGTKMSVEDYDNAIARINDILNSAIAATPSDPSLRI